MKTKVISLLIRLLYFSIIVAGQNVKMATNPIGKWKFNAPDAPEGYSSGTIIFNLVDQKYSAAIMFLGSDYKIPGEKTKIENDSISFFVNIEGQSVTVKLKMESDMKMSGKAIYSDGTITLILTKDDEKAVK